MPAKGLWQAGYDAAMKDAADFLVRHFDQPTIAADLLRHHGVRHPLPGANVDDGGAQA